MVNNYRKWLISIENGKKAQKKLSLQNFSLLVKKKKKKKNGKKKVLKDKRDSFYLDVTWPDRDRPTQIHDNPRNKRQQWQHNLLWIVAGLRPSRLGVLPCFFGSSSNMLFSRLAWYSKTKNENHGETKLFHRFKVATYSS